jgi:hypothetical protein
MLSWGERLGAIVIAGLTVWYWPSPWPVIIGFGYAAIQAFLTVRVLVRGQVLHAAIASPSRPMHMRWTLSVWLTERAWGSLGIAAEDQPKLQGFLGTYEGGYKYLFEGEPTPQWVGNPITITYEAWGESLERWQVLSPAGANPSGNVQEYIPAAETQAREIVEFWPPFFRYQDGVLLFADPSSGSLMPDYKLFRPTKVLFKIPAPTHRRRHWAWQKDAEIATNDLEQFAVPSVYSGDGIWTWFQRQPTHERFVCVDREKGVRWEMDVNDLRHWLVGHVVGVRRQGFFRRGEVIAFRVRLDDSGLLVEAGPQAITPNESGGSTTPRKGDYAQVVLDEQGQVDRVWLSQPWKPQEPKQNSATRRTARPSKRRAER